ncbi:MAG: hypothetical protein ACHQUC_05205 [Chlamydiales bacterium]
MRGCIVDEGWVVEDIDDEVGRDDVGKDEDMDDEVGKEDVGKDEDMDEDVGSPAALREVKEKVKRKRNIQ